MEGSGPTLERQKTEIEIRKIISTHKTMTESHHDTVEPEPLNTDIARHIVSNTSDTYVDLVELGEGDSPWLAVVQIERDGIVFYSDSVEYSEAWQGAFPEIVDKAISMLEKEFAEHDRRDLDPKISYDPSHDPIFNETFDDRTDFEV